MRRIQPVESARLSELLGLSGSVLTYASASTYHIEVDDTDLDNLQEGLEELGFELAGTDPPTPPSGTDIKMVEAFFGVVLAGLPYVVDDTWTSVPMTEADEYDSSFFTFSGTPSVPSEIVTVLGAGRYEIYGKTSLGRITASPKGVQAMLEWWDGATWTMIPGTLTTIEGQQRINSISVESEGTLALNASDQVRMRVRRSMGSGNFFGFGSMLKVQLVS